jgi:hypothetical protein
MSIDRAIAVTYPLKAATLCTASRAIKVTVITCTSQVIINIQKFFSYKLPDPPNGGLLRDIPGAKWVETLLDVYQLVIGTAAPFTILIVCNTIIIINVRRAASARKKMDSNLDKKTKGTNLTVLLLMTSLAYLICSIPKRVGDIFIKYDMSQIYWSTRYWFEWRIFSELWSFNFAINFYIYFLGGGRKFRQDSIEVFRRFCNPLCKNVQE